VPFSIDRLVRQRVSADGRVAAIQKPMRMVGMLDTKGCRHRLLTVDEAMVTRVEENKLGGIVMPKAHLIRAWLLAGVTSVMVGAVALTEPALAQMVQDPGIRGGPPGAGGPLPGLSNFPGELGFFNAAQGFFTQVNSVTGSVNDGAALGVANGGPGLGPRYNLNQCSACHAQPAIGGTSPRVNPEVAAATLDGARNSVPSFVTINGPVREARFVLNTDGTPDGQVHELFTITGRPDAPGCNIAQPNFAAQLAANNAIFRIPTPIFGAGLVEQISDLTLQTNFAENPFLKSQLGISGHFNTSPNDGTITRFGWKAQNKSLLMFSGEAYLVEIGVTNELFPNKRDIETTPTCQFNGLPEDLTVFGTSDPVSPPSGSTASDFSTGIINFSMFMRLTAPPEPAPSTASTLHGAQVFNNIGCQACHAPTQQTGLTAYYYNNYTFSPFSDFAVHNMGYGLADRITQGNATGQEFRTAPLWGVGQRIFFLHDGRTTDLLEAIQQHASAQSEANAVINNFNLLAPQDKQALLNYLRSL
jgi:CxxC motif-containing protein (DUF1111 family)